MSFDPHKRNGKMKTNLVCLGYFLKFLRGIWVFVRVGMIFLGELVIRLLDVLS